MAQVGGTKKRKRQRTSAKNRPAEESQVVARAFAEIVEAVRMYADGRARIWRRRAPGTIATGLKAAKLELAKRLTNQVERLTDTGIPLSRREKVAIAYVTTNAKGCTTDAKQIDVHTWEVFECPDEGDALRDSVMNINLSWMMERILAAREG